MKVGDLIRAINPPGCSLYQQCSCWFCYNDSTRMGIILEKLSCGANGKGYWEILFDAGRWRLYGSEIKVIPEVSN